MTHRAALAILLGLLSTTARADVQRVYFQRKGAVLRVHLPGGQAKKLAAATGSYSAAPLAVSPDGANVTFNLNYNLYRVGAGGGAPVRLTKLGRVVRPDNEAPEADVCDVPLLSPDGQWLAYRFTPVNGLPQIRCCTATGGDDRTLVKGPVLGPEAWDRTSGQVVYSHERRLWRIAPTNGEPAGLTNPEVGSDGQASFAADGRLAFCRDLTPLLLQRNGEIRRPGPREFQGQFPRVSPDGRWLAVQHHVQQADNQSDEIKVVDLASGATRRLMTTAGKGSAALVGWLNKGTVVVVRDLPKSRKLYRVDAADGRAAMLLKLTPDDDCVTLWPQAGPS